MQPGLSARWRRLRMGLATVTGLRQLGWFIPYRDAAPPPDGFVYPAIERFFRAHEPAFEELIGEMARLADELAALTGPPPRPRWNQGWFARLDGAAAYTLVRSRRPARIVEIGSGHSTRFLHAAIADGALDCRLTAIDPQPRADIAALPIEHIRAPLQQAGLDGFAGLTSGDMVFVDSSHILMPGSDADLIISQVLPALPSGVLVHFHDIFLPDDYPASWRWRGYNEQQGIGALLASGGFEPVFASHYVATRMAAQMAKHPVARLPLLQGVCETSLWLVKSAPALAGHGAVTRE